MQEIEVKTTIVMKENGEVLTKITEAAGTPDNKENMAAGHIFYPDKEKEITEHEAEQYAVVSELANICEYLEEHEIIKIKLIIQKAKARKEREECG